MYTIKEAIEEFIFQCKFQKGLSENTIRFYTIDLFQFNRFLEENDLCYELEGIHKDHLRQYLKYLENRKPKTIKRKIATLKSFFRTMEFDDHIPYSPFRKLKIQIKEEKQLPKALSLYEMKSILVEVYKSQVNKDRQSKHLRFQNSRNIAVIEMLFATGIRVSELSNLKFENVDLRFGSVLVNGKGSKERIVYVCSTEALKALREYLINLQEFASDSKYFFVNRLGRKLSDQSIRSMVKALASNTNIKLKVTPHVFRHTFATLLLENDVDIKYIQSFLGHSSIVTTQIYTHVSKGKQRKILLSRHPRKDMLN